MTCQRKTAVIDCIDYSDYHQSNWDFFATSVVSKFGKTDETLKVSVPSSCEIIEGTLINSIQTTTGIRKWTETLNQ